MICDVYGYPRSVVPLSGAVAVRCDHTAVSKKPISEFAINRLNDTCDLLADCR